MGNAFRRRERESTADADPNVPVATPRRRGSSAELPKRRGRSGGPTARRGSTADVDPSRRKSATDATQPPKRRRPKSDAALVTGRPKRPTGAPRAKAPRRQPNAAAIPRESTTDEAAPTHPAPAQLGPKSTIVEMYQPVQPAGYVVPVAPPPMVVPVYSPPHSPYPPSHEPSQHSDHQEEEEEDNDEEEYEEEEPELMTGCCICHNAGRFGQFCKCIIGLKCILYACSICKGKNVDGECCCVD